MGSIFQHQTKLRIILNLNADISDYAKIYIKYFKPSSEPDDENYWDAKVQDAKLGIIYYDIQGKELDEFGYWKFWALIEFKDGKIAPSEVKQVYVYKEGDLPST